MAVLAYHVVFGAYGFWLPNDPRGSWSDFVRNWDLTYFGKATKTNTRMSVAGNAHNAQLREEAKGALEYKPVHLSGKQALAAAKGFTQAQKEGNYNIHACSILPEHVHLVIGRHERHIGRIVAHMKTRATQRIRSEGLCENNESPIWARRYWKVFLDSPQEVKQAIEYVKRNPEKEGKRQQKWSFVVPFII